MSSNLLPPNASQLVRDLVDANKVDDELEQGINALANLKRNPPDSFLDWLIWGYGLEEIAPYIKDKRQAIRTGRDWQRIRGTPRSLLMALGWVGFDDAEFEQFGPGVNSPRYMVQAGRIPRGSEIDDLISVSNLSAPVATRLWRVWHGYDVRALILSKHRLGQALLSDASGVRHNGVKLSFGERFSGHAVAPPAQTDFAVQDHVTFAAKYNPHMMLLGSFKLGDKAQVRSGAGVFDVYARHASIDPVVSAAEHRRFAYSHMTLSGGKLSSDRSYLGLRTPVESGEAMRLSATRLGAPYRIRYQPIFIVYTKTSAGAAAYAEVMQAMDGYALTSAVQVIADHDTDEGQTLTSSAALSVRSLGLQWIGPWDNRAWNTFDHITIGTIHSDSSS